MDKYKEKYLVVYAGGAYYVERRRDGHYLNKNGIWIKWCGLSCDTYKYNSYRFIVQKLKSVTKNLKTTAVLRDPFNKSKIIEARFVTR